MTNLQKIKDERLTLRLARTEIEGMIAMLDVYIENFGPRGFHIRHEVRRRRKLAKQLKNINEQLNEIEHRFNWDISLYPEQERALDAALQER